MNALNVAVVTGAVAMATSGSVTAPDAARATRKPAEARNEPRFDDYLDGNDSAGSAADEPSTVVKADDSSATSESDEVADERVEDGSPTGLDLVSTLLQTILAMPQRQTPDGVRPSFDTTVAGNATGVEVIALTVADAGAGGNGMPPDATAPVTASNTIANLTSLAATGVDAEAASRTTDAAAALRSDATPVADLAALSSDRADGAALDALMALTAAAPPSSQTGVAPTPSAAPTHSLPTAPGEIVEPLAEQIVWMTDSAKLQAGGLQEARINLHPAELGSLQIRVQIDSNGNAKVLFDVETPQARQAIESSLPQLRELLSSQVVMATHSSFELSGGLSQQPSSSDAQQRPSQTPAANPDGEPSPTDAPSVEPARITRQRVGLLDQFA
ncbi:hook-length control protein FliK [Hydrocarboniphaga daqingensis]|uniref:Hook-length control protein FliK n=1 Tax=Hydrocarboniphaga daqingensis TaxID=490188 RepID=A0A1M5JQW1_9GAMM|nr:flagellar hook-length control protein FliK [Hydrocarboniphaga daqingensis]SHG42908.1 hook-length control protein FliK [Hydrocarboniphaga daqingensis]